ncbi:MAG TPA: TROVE domain-containing protein [Pseudoneobacillus sp.]|nr:TROVE domain-containing protein [Pseudoneobacillus sp.]
MSRAKNLFSTPVVPPTTTVNKEGYGAYNRTMEEEYVQMLLTNTIGSTFYADKNELLKEAHSMHDAMMKQDPLFAAKALKFARNKGYMRLQPTLGLAKLASANKELFKQAFPGVISIPSDLQDFFTMINGMGRGEGGRAIKGAAAKFMNKLSEYWAIKYNGQGRGYAVSDIIATTHPKPVNAKQQAIFAYLMGKQYDRNLLPQIDAYEALKKATNDDEIIKLIHEGRLPHEVVTGVVSKPSAKVWEAIMANMPIFAMLRNFNTLERAGVLDKNMDLVKAKFTKDAVLNSKILPYQLLTAMNNITNNKVKDYIRMAIEYSIENIPDIPGETAIHLDKSGSMSGQYLMTAGIFGFGLYKKSNAEFKLFNTHVEDANASMVDSVLTQASGLRASGGTDTGACLRDMISRKKKVDNIIIITDEQQNAGSSFYSALLTYRKQVNKDVKAFIIDIAPYRNSMVPPTDKNTFYIYGWSDQVLKFISSAAKGYGTMVDEIRNSQL